MTVNFDITWGFKPPPFVVGAPIVSCIVAPSNPGEDLEIHVHVPVSIEL
jgi:hypothetical protein